MYVAVVSCLNYCNKISEDMALVECLKNIGVSGEVVPWDDENIGWKKYDIAVLRSAWGYHKQYDKFLNWLSLLDKNGLPLINNTDIVRWNTNKEVQFATLSQLKVPVIPYVISDSWVNFERLYQILHTKKLVCKPIISASGDDTYVVNGTDQKNSIQSNKIKTVFKGRKFIVQPFVESVHNGEYALVFFNGEFSHAVLRFPGVFTDKKACYYMPKPDVPKSIMNMAVDTAEKIRGHFGENPVYARYDMVNDGIMEIELAEPDLMTRNIPIDQKQSALTKFADIILKRWQR